MEESRAFGPEKLGIRVLDTEINQSEFLTPATAPLPSDIRLATRFALPHVSEDYFSPHRAEAHAGPVLKPRPDFDFWKDLPYEIRIQVLNHLKHQELVRCSAVSSTWHKMCFDGQLWQNLDAVEFYTRIPAQQLSRIIRNAGPFVKTLGLRGCRQLEDQWSQGLSGMCTNLETFNIQGCMIQRPWLRSIISQNTRLVRLDISGVAAVSNSVCAVIAETCQQLEYLDVSFCASMDARGLWKVVDNCTRLKTLRLGELRALDNKELMLRLFELNTLERLDLRQCTEITDTAFKTLLDGDRLEIDVLSGRVIVPPRRLRHLDLSNCSGLTDRSVESLVGNVPELENLQLCGCHHLTDTLMEHLLPTVPALSVFNLDGLLHLTNATLIQLAKAPCAENLTWLTISDCEKLGDMGMIHVIQACKALQTLVMDNTRIGDLTLVKMASALHWRNWSTKKDHLPHVALRLEVYDCPNVTWTGIREVLSRNTETVAPTITQDGFIENSKAIISLHCFYGWQQTVDEHEKRVLRGNLVSASRLERKWADYMMAYEDAEIPGSGIRRRRRRMREAALLMHADTDEAGTGGIGRRRRARSGGCSVM
jgi:F-box/leucine-rich repeat protein 2/20